MKVTKMIGLLLVGCIFTGIQAMEDIPYTNEDRLIKNTITIQDYLSNWDPSEIAVTAQINALRNSELYPELVRKINNGLRLTRANARREDSPRLLHFKTQNLIDLYYGKLEK